MTDYIIFSLLLIAFMIVFIRLWKTRKNKNAELTEDGFNNNLHPYDDWPP